MMDEETKENILIVMKEAYPGDLSIVEVAQSSHLSRGTASTWLKVLEAEGKIEFSRNVGNAVLYRIKNKPR